MTDLLSNPVVDCCDCRQSEIIGMSKLKDNSIVELVLHAVMRAQAKRQIRAAIIIRQSFRC